MTEALYVPTASPRERALRRGEAALYGRSPVDTTVRTAEDIATFWADEFQARVRADQDALVLAWGPGGSGKSTCVMDLARRVDETFTADTLPERYAFRAHHVPTLYQRTPRYGAAVIDEAVSSGLLATDTFTPEQKELVELINIIRAKNVVLFVLLPDPSDLAKAFRARRADYRIEVEKETFDSIPVAHIGRRVRGRKHFLDDGRWLGFMDDPDENPYRWDEYKGSDDAAKRALWDVYYPLKMKYLDERVDSLKRRMEARAHAREDKERRAAKE